MRNKFKYPTRALLFLASILMVAACMPSNPFVHTPISGAMFIDNREQEIIFDKPFKPEKQVIKVCFEYSDKLRVESISEPPKFPDGTALQLTVSIIDQNGRKYELSRIANSVENALCISPELTSEWMNISKTDVTFAKLIVHSNRKISVSQILWVSFNTWEI